MTLVERIRKINADYGVDHAFAPGAGESICFGVEEAAGMTPRRAKIAWRERKCPLCFWALVFFFGIRRGAV